MVARLPERSERTGSPIEMRAALRLLRSERLLRRYLAGVATAGAARSVIFPFALVMLQRLVGFSEGQVLYTTVAIFARGLATLLLWRRIVDRVGPEPVFRWTCLGQAGLVLALDAAAHLLAIPPPRLPPSRGRRRPGRGLIPPRNAPQGTT